MDTKRKLIETKLTEELKNMGNMYRHDVMAKCILSMLESHGVTLPPPSRLNELHPESDLYPSEPSDMMYYVYLINLWVTNFEVEPFKCFSSIEAADRFISDMPIDDVYRAADLLNFELNNDNIGEFIRRELLPNLQIVEVEVDATRN